MPTPIKYHPKKVDERDNLKNAVRDICRVLSRSYQNKYSLSYEGLVRMVWTKEQFDMVNHMRGFLGPIAFDEQPVSVRAPVMLTHPALPGDKPVEVTADFYIENPKSTVPRPFPREWNIGSIKIPVSDVLAADLNEMAHQALDFYCIRETLMHLVTKCDTYEQALYMFPYFRIVIKRAHGLNGKRDLEVKRAPNALPKTSERLRRMMKHAHTLMGMHTLLGTFDNDETPHVAPKNEDTCIVTLVGNNPFEVDNSAGLAWEYDLTFTDN